MPPPTASVIVPGTPATVYDAILPEIRDRVAHETKMVRIDSGASVTMRFTAYLEDHSVRLVEVRLDPVTASSTAVAAHSRKFSFMPGRSRDAEDATLEKSLLALIARQTTAPSPPSADAR